MKIPFNRPLILGTEQGNLNKVFEYDKFSGNGVFSSACSELLEKNTNCEKAIMTSSCTDALEMAALLCDLGPGDEVIIPSYAFVTTASAFALRGVKIVWCDIRRDTKNIDESEIESLITAKTRAIVIVHYGGVACEMDRISEICKKYNLYLIEDAAQAIGCSYKGKRLGGFGDLAALSFHGDDSYAFTHRVLNGLFHFFSVILSKIIGCQDHIINSGINRSSNNIRLVTMGSDADKPCLSLLLRFNERVYQRFVCGHLRTITTMKVENIYIICSETLEARFKLLE